MPRGTMVFLKQKLRAEEKDPVSLISKTLDRDTSYDYSDKKDHVSCQKYNPKISAV